MTGPQEQESPVSTRIANDADPLSAPHAAEASVSTVRGTIVEGGQTKVEGGDVSLQTTSTEHTEVRASRLKREEREADLKL